MTDLFLKKPTQSEIIYDFIKRRGRVLSHELNAFAVSQLINCPGSRVRELKAKGLVWHVRPLVRTALWPGSKEIGWSVYEGDR